MTDVQPPTERRLSQLLQHLGIARVHFATAIPRDSRVLTAIPPETVASLTLVTGPKIRTSIIAQGLLCVH